MNNRIKIYTDGACSGNQLEKNKGGYAAIIFKPGEEPLKLSGGYKNTTNNRMELKAVIEALKRVPKSKPVTVYSDSEYVVLGITERIHNCIKEGRLMKNEDLCIELYRLKKRFDDIEFKHVESSGFSKKNNEANKLAKEACKGFGLPEDIR